MKKIILIFSFVALIIGISVQKVQAQASINAHATAEVIQALTATESATLNFGRFSPETAGGEVKLSPDGVRSSSGTIAMGGGIYNPAIFYLTGQPEFSVTITLPAVAVLLTNSANGKTMEVTNWESYPSASGSGVKMLSNGLLTLSIGATLKVGNMNDNPVGVYAGTYAITFSYN